MSELSSVSGSASAPWWRRPAVLSLMAVVLILAAALAWPLLQRRTEGAGPAPAADGLPWQVKTSAEGAEVFGVLIGQSRVDEVVSRFGDNFKLGLIQPVGVAGDDAPALEGYVDSFQAGFVSGRLVFAFEADDALRRQAASRAVRKDVGEGGRTRILSLASEDRDTRNADSLASQSRLVGLSFIPAARLDEATVVARFGAPAERFVASGGELQLLYPGLGVAVAVPAPEDAKGRVVIQYVAPGEFEARLRQPLAAASAAR